MISRIGDLLLLYSLFLLYQELGTLEFTSIFQAARSAHMLGAGASCLPTVAILFALAALFKSAQFPIHGWLLEVMETPTPVSALLHAGVINAGGFLLIRFSYLLTLSPFAMNLLIVIGTLTAVFGSLVMLTQTSIKVSLAYSTIAQMGFMMLECGLGVFSAAMLHIIAHSLYKAHAFLSSGEAAKSPQRKDAHFRVSLEQSTFAISATTLLTLLTVTVVGIYFDSTLITHPGSLTLAYIFALGMAMLLASGFDGRPSALFLARILVSTLAFTVLFFAFEQGAEFAFKTAAQTEQLALGRFDLSLRISVILAFSAAMAIQRTLNSNKGRFWMAFYTHLSNGFYINTIANRLAIRFWPGAAPRLAAPSYIPTYSEREEP